MPSSFKYFAQGVASGLSPLSEARGLGRDGPMSSQHDILCKAPSGERNEVRVNAPFQITRG